MPLYNSNPKKLGVFQNYALYEPHYVTTIEHLNVGDKFKLIGHPEADIYQKTSSKPKRSYFVHEGVRKSYLGFPSICLTDLFVLEIIVYQNSPVIKLLK